MEKTSRGLQSVIDVVCVNVKYGIKKSKMLKLIKVFLLTGKV